MSTSTLYGATWLGSLAACLALMPAVVAVGQAFGLAGLPNSRKLRVRSTSGLGGMGVAAPVLLAGIGTVMFARHFSHLAGTPRQPLISLLTISGFIVLLGVIDDVLELSSKIKFLGLIVAAAAACITGIRIESIVLHGHHPIYLGIFSWPITMLWLIGVSVGINFSDGLEGLAAGLTGIASAVVAAVAIWSGQTAVALLALSLLGSLCASLIYQLNPGRRFIGDCGGMFVGFLVAALCVLEAPAAGTTAGLLLPAIALSIPTIDAMLTVIRRVIVSRRSMFSPDRGHIHHRLLDMGLCERHAVLILYGCALLTTAIGLLALLDSGVARIGGFLLLAPMLLAIFRTAGSARLHETIAAIRRNRAIARETRRYQRAFEDMQLRFRAADTFDAWWKEVAIAAQKLDFISIRIPIMLRDRKESALCWNSPDATLLGHERMNAVVPVRDRRASGPLMAHIAVTTHTSLESAGHRVALFSRLMGEYHPAALAQTTYRRAVPEGRPSAGRVAAGAGVEAGIRFLRDQMVVRPTHRLEPILNASADHATMRVISRSLLAPRTDKRGDAKRTAIEILQNGHAPAAADQLQLPSQLRIAIVHDFLYVYAGAERVLEQIISLYPTADVFSIVDFLPEDQRGFLQSKAVTTSFIQNMPYARQKHRAYLPLMPFAVEQLDVSSYDLVISSSYLAAKGVMTGPDQLHICYCHTPARFAWDLQHQYLHESGLLHGLRSLAARIVLHYIRQWDAHSAKAVDVFVTNSDFVGRRIAKLYRRVATTIYPPVAVDGFAAGRTDVGQREDFYLTASRMVPYKRIDLIISAFNSMPDRRLVVVGEGPMLEKMRAMAGPNVRIVGRQSFENLKRYMHLARAFIFAAEEDFGIVPVEAQACGTPVIAFGRGGVTESVQAGKTGVFFSEQSVESLVQAVREFEQVERQGGWDRERICRNAERFSIARFRESFHNLVTAEWHAFSSRRGQQEKARKSPPPSLAPSHAGRAYPPADGSPARYSQSDAAM